jgi:hypothetical protein
MRSIHRIHLAAVAASLLLAGGCIDETEELQQAPAAAGTEVSAMGMGHGGGHRRPEVSRYATGLTFPRGMTFGPDGNLYVAEAGIGGPLQPPNTPECPAFVNIYSPYLAGYTGRVSRVLANGTRQTVADQLPSATDKDGIGYGPTAVAFIGRTLYVLIEMGGCSHGLPDDLPAILRVNPDGSTTSVANLNAWLAANPVNFIQDTNPATTDLEPGGVWHSMIAVGKHLYVVETNRGQLLRVDPASGAITRVHDLSIDEAEHNPIALTRLGNALYVGTFGEDANNDGVYGKSKLMAYDLGSDLPPVTFQALNPLTGIAARGHQLYGLEIFPREAAWTPDSANLVTFDPRTGQRRQLLTAFASFPNGLITGPDGALYAADCSICGEGAGSVLRIDP